MMFEKIKDSLPLLPEEVIRTWLVPIAEGGYGWPPPEYDLGKWRYVLARQSLDHWNKTKWAKAKHNLDNQTILSMTDNPIIGSSAFNIVEAHTLNKKNAFSETVDGKKRFFNLVDYILKHGTMPFPPIVRSLEERFEIVDGNHRLAALIHVRALWEKDGNREVFLQKGYTPISVEHCVWVATPPEEGSYIPNPLTKEQDERIKQQYEQLRINRAGWR